FLWLLATTDYFPDRCAHSYNFRACAIRPIHVRFMHCTGDEIRQSNEVCHKTRLGTLVHFSWRALLFQLTSMHDGNAVRESNCLFLVMRHIDESNTNRVLKRFQLRLHILALL